MRTGYLIGYTIHRYYNGVEQVKTNDPADPDYKPKELNLTACPIDYDLTCVDQLIWCIRNTWAEYEFYLKPSVAKNPAVKKVKIALTLGSGGTELSSTIFNMPQDPPYFSGILTGAVSSGQYYLTFYYLDASNNVLATCLIADPFYKP